MVSLNWPRKRNREKSGIPEQNEAGKNKQVLQANCLNRLMDARYQVTVEELRTLELEFPGTWFLLILIKQTAPSKAQPFVAGEGGFQEFCQQMELWLRETGVTAYVFPSQWDIFAVVNFSDQAPEVRQAQIGGRLEEILKLLSEESVKAFVSDVGNGLASLPKLHQQVAQLCDYGLFLAAPDAVITHGQLSVVGSNCERQFHGLRSMEETQRFFTNIMKENMVEARDSMNKLISDLLVDLDTEVVPLSLARARLGYLINTMDIAVDYLRLRMNSNIFSRLFPRLDFRACENVQEFQHQVNTIFDEFEIIIGQEQGKTPYALSWVSDMMRYVDLHFSDPTLNVGSLSERFQMNPTYVSRVFREKSGTSPSEYIRAARLRMAESMMAAGATVQEAAQRSGFGSVRTMQRAFQKNAGVSPREKKFGKEIPGGNKMSDK